MADISEEDSFNKAIYEKRALTKKSAGRTIKKIIDNINKNCVEKKKIEIINEKKEIGCVNGAKKETTTMTLLNNIPTSLLVDKTQSDKEIKPETMKVVKLTNEKISGAKQPKTRRLRKKKKVSLSTSSYSRIDKKGKECISEDISEKEKLTKLFKKFGNSLEDSKKKDAVNLEKNKTSDQYKFREKVQLINGKDDENSFILLPPNKNLERLITVNGVSKTIQPEQIKRTKREQKMVEELWFNRFNEENTLDDVPSDWDENRRPKTKKRRKRKDAREYDDVII
uniref:Uncharacterized protein n=1 Tax=Parastrongyloides trichosuri TaxID=131310 RepID=A0A0N4Z4A7_PARTI